MIYKRKRFLNKNKGFKYNNTKIKKTLTLNQMDEKENIKEITQEFEFDSQLEYLHALKFRQDEIDKKIKYYIFKPPRIELTPSYKEVKFHPSYYKIDHLIIHNNGKKEYIDSKGMELPESILKRKFLYYRYKIYVQFLKK